MSAKIVCGGGRDLCPCGGEHIRERADDLEFGRVAFTFAGEDGDPLDHGAGGFEQFWIGLVVDGAMQPRQILAIFASKIDIQ